MHVLKSHTFAGKGGCTIQEMKLSTTGIVLSRIGIGGVTFKGPGSMLISASWPSCLSLLNCLMVLNFWVKWSDFKAYGSSHIVFENLKHKKIKIISKNKLDTSKCI